MLLSTNITPEFLKCLCGANSSNSVEIGSSGSCYLGLFTKMPNSNGSGGIEPSSDYKYKRIKINGLMNVEYKSHANSDSTQVSYTRRIGNRDDIQFPESQDDTDEDATQGGDWGLIVGYGLFTSDNAGTPYAWGELNTPVRIGTHKTLLFRKGHFEFFMDADEENYSITFPENPTGYTITRPAKTLIKVVVASGYTGTPSVTIYSGGGTGCAITLNTDYSVDLTGTDFVNVGKEYVYVVSGQSADLTVAVSGISQEES